jgi:hypothetical protein
MNSLKLTYSNLGKWNEAEMLQAQVLEMTEKKGFLEQTTDMHSFKK